MSYVWDFGGGETATGISPSHTFANPGTFPVTLTVTDQFGLTAQTTASITVTNAPPVASFTAAPAEGPTPLNVSFDASGSTDPNDFIVSYTWDFGGGETATGISPSHTFSSPGTFTVALTVADSFGAISESSQTVTAETPAPSIPGVIPDAPSLDNTLIADLSANTAFLYTGPNAVQTGVAPGTIEKVRAAVVRGRVFTRDGTPLPGVTVTIKDHPEFGQTLTRADGFYDLAVNGGAQLILDFSLNGFLPGQRQLNVPWQDFAVAEDIALVQLDAKSTTVDLANATAPTLALASPVTDADGTRQAAVLFPLGTTAEMVLPDGTTQPLTSMTVRATEYTVGDNGPMSMPGELPPLSGYTYAVELSVDEALSAEADSVNFNQAIPAYVDNFLSFPAGVIVPSGFYDPKQGQWIASESGVVIDILSVTGGLANLDVDGSATPANATLLSSLGITDAERQTLATQYGAGKSLWRVPVTHFSTYDFNYARQVIDPNAVDPPSKQDVVVAKFPNQCTVCAGSIIQAEGQILGQAIPVAGTPLTLHYNSDRTPGFKDEFTTTVPVTGPVVPSSLQKVDVTITIAGRVFPFSFNPGNLTPNQSFDFTWDGLDAYGRPLSGKTAASVVIDYAYQGFYVAGGGFGKPGTGTIIGTARKLFFKKSGYTVTLGTIDTRSLGLGGWTLDQHHVYDPFEPILHLGPGPRRSSESLPNVISTTGGNGTNSPAFSIDGTPATSVGMGFIDGLAEDSKGNLYVSGPQCRILRVDTEGNTFQFAGTKFGGCSKETGGAGAPATGVFFRFLGGLAIDKDDNVYVIQTTNDKIREIRASDGGVYPAAGSGARGFSGDGGPANSAALNLPEGIATDSEGNLYIADTQNNRVRKVDVSTGIIDTVVGTGVQGFSGDGGLALNAQLHWPSAIAFDDEGNMFIADRRNSRVRKVDALTGIITTVAGTGQHVAEGNSNNLIIDGVPATQTAFHWIHSLDFDKFGNLVIGSLYRVRLLDQNGIIHTVAGADDDNRYNFNGEDIPATRARLGSLSQLAVAQDGTIITALRSNKRVRKIAPPLPGFGVQENLLTSEDGSEVYAFDPSGRHLRTLNALTGATVFDFAYDASGKLSTITDGDGNVTTLERNASDELTGIRSPDGQVTLLTLNNAGYITGITNPNGETPVFSYTPEGLMLSMTDARNNTSVFSYGPTGRLTTDADAAGGSQTFARSGPDNNFVVTRTTALSRISSFGVQQLLAGGNLRTVTDPDGLATTTFNGDDDSQTITAPDGTVTTVTKNPDPRFGMQSPLSNLTVTTPGGRVSTLTTSRSVALADPLDLFSMTSMVDTLILNGRPFASVYDAAALKFTDTTPEGRSTTSFTDSQGRITKEQVAGLEDTDFFYDTRGRLTDVQQGAGANARLSTIAYDSNGFVSSVTDPLNRSVQFQYDLAGRVTKQILPDLREIIFSYDSNGNVVSITPPGRPAHAFQYTAVDLESEYSPPDVGLVEHRTFFAYNVDKQLTSITRPDAKTVTFNYEPGGRVASFTIPRGSTSFAYSALTGNVTSITAPDGGALTFSYDGSLLLSSTWAGTIAGSVARTYDNDLRVTTRRVNGGNAISFGYDSDSLLTSAGAETLGYDPSKDLLTGTTLGVVADSYGYNTFAEVTDYTASANGSPVYQTQFARDKLGRITQKVETAQGVHHTFDYFYDFSGRLIAVNKDGVSSEVYTYDSNGNRTNNGAVYDDQDRLTSLGAASYSYTANGELLSKTDSAGTTTYNYDVLGNLLSANVAGGSLIEYIVDASNRRIGKKVDGTLEKGWLYKDQLNPIAELDGAGNVVSRFVYASRSNVPDFIIKGGSTYRIISDHLGSPRLAIDVATGLPAQLIEYDSFGNVIADTNPGFQPFGFAGGLYDEDTKLTRFGARDYDAETGRWASKDPIRFNGGDTNLFGYVLSDPVNLIDPFGLIPPALVPQSVIDNTKFVVNQVTRGAFTPAELDIATRVLIQEVGLFEIDDALDVGAVKFAGDKLPLTRSQAQFIGDLINRGAKVGVIEGSKQIQDIFNRADKEFKRATSLGGICPIVN